MSLASDAPRFTIVRWREGYDIVEVDAFVALVASGSVTVEQAKQVRFRPTECALAMTWVKLIISSTSSLTRTPRRADTRVSDVGQNRRTALRLGRGPTSFVLSYWPQQLWPV